MQFRFKNILEGKSFRASLKKNMLSVLVGRNGYGKTSFIRSLERYGEEHGFRVLAWNDNDDGRGEARKRFLSVGDIESLAMVSFHSEGQTLLNAFSVLFVDRAGRLARTAKKGDKLLLLADQVDSGLDICRIDDIKDFLKNVMIPDMVSKGLEVYCVLTANSFEMAVGEDCVDPRTGKHMVFNDLDSYRDYIARTYEEE